MKAKKDLRKGHDTRELDSKDLKVKKLAPEKKIKNEKRALYNDADEDEDLDYLVGRKKESILDYYGDDEEDFDEDDDFDEEEDFDDEEED